MTISGYRDAIKTLMGKIGDMKTRCAAENGREPTEAEVSLRNKLLDEIESLREKLSLEEREERMRMELEKSPEPITRPGPRPQAPEERKGDRFSTLGEQLVAVRSANLGRGTDPRLFRAASGLNETVPSDGGFLVQQDFTNELLQETFSTGLLASRCRRIQISGNANSIKINGVDETSRASTRYGGILGYWEEEAADKTESKPKFRKIELSLKKLIGLCYATDELLDDASALEGIIRTAFPAEFGFLLDDAIVNGTGAGQPLGILNAGCLVSVSKESGQKAATLLAENVIKMYSRMFASSQPSAVWLINNSVYPQLFQMSLSVGTGGIPVYMPAGGLSGQQYGSLFGRPVLAIEQCAALGTVGDIIFADLNGGYLLAEKGGIKSDVSIHVKFTTDQSTFRFVMRVDGQPVRASALTPYKGSDTLSHFVALASRA